MTNERIAAIAWNAAATLNEQHNKVKHVLWKNLSLHDKTDMIAEVRSYRNAITTGDELEEITDVYLDNRRTLIYGIVLYTKDLQ